MNKSGLSFFGIYQVILLFASMYWYNFPLEYLFKSIKDLFVFFFPVF